MDSVNEPLASMRRQLLVALPAALLCAALGGYWLAARALRPVDDITRTARAITAEDLQRRIDYHGPPDEIGRLALTIDHMLARLEAGFDRERRFSADAAHELRTPLAALKGRIEVTLGQPRTAAAYVETLRDLEAQVDRLARLGNDLLLLSRLPHDPSPRAAEKIRLSDFLPAVLDVITPLAEAKAITLDLDVPRGVAIDGRPELLTRLLLNLLDNAIRHTPPGGRIAVRVAHEPQTIAIAVSDSGPGIAAEHLPYLFERFYRVDDDRSRDSADNGLSGSGLGLALAREIALAHGGDLTAGSEPGQGATFTAIFPRPSVGA
jgi:heavy metal sensor kinase